MKFKAGDKVWAFSHGINPRSAPRGWYAAVVISPKLRPQQRITGIIAYKLDVPGCVNPSGSTIWYCNEPNMRPRDDGEDAPTLDANKKVSWDKCIWRPAGVKA